MYFKPFQFYTHRNLIDTCIQVHRIHHDPVAGSYKMYVSWFLRRNLAPIGVSEMIVVRKDQVMGWREMNLHTDPPEAA